MPQLTTSHGQHSRARAAGRVSIILAMTLPIFLIAASVSLAAPPPVNLGTADGFAVLAGQAITNTGPTTITGDVGLHPGSGPTGFGSVTLNGTLHDADAVALQAKNDLVTAYNTAAGSLPVSTIATELGGQILTAGVYDSASGTFEITGTVTLDAEGDPDAVFVFLTDSTLITHTASVVSIINSGQACNVFWQVGSSATLDTTSTFRGNILALTSITLVTGAMVDGRVLARNGSVTLDSNTITRAVCDTAPPPTTTTSTAATTTLATTTTLGGPETGGGSTVGFENRGLLAIGAVLLAVAFGAFAYRRRVDRRGSWS